MKLEPMNALELIASINPLQLSETPISVILSDHFNVTIHPRRRNDTPREQERSKLMKRCVALVLFSEEQACLTRRR